ncbi:MAG: hypothetical protein WBB01_04715 [Phormidesmis sp.]
MTYIQSPLHLPEQEKQEKRTPPEAMSDAFDEQDSHLPAPDSAESGVKSNAPSAPQTRLAVSKSKLPANWLPAGAIMRLNLFAELGFFLVLWAAYGFAMQYASKPVQRLISSLVSLMFSRWAIALVLLGACLIICRFLASLGLRCKDLQRMAYATRDSADTYDHADTEDAVLDLLHEAKEAIAKRQRWITTLFCAISAYLIVSLLY